MTTDLSRQLRQRAEICWRSGLFDLAGSYHSEALKAEADAIRARYIESQPTKQEDAHA